MSRPWLPSHLKKYSSDMYTEKLPCKNQYYKNQPKNNLLNDNPDSIEIKKTKRTTCTLTNKVLSGKI